MGLLVKGYKSKGEKVLANFEANHKNDENKVQKALQRKKEAVVKSYKSTNEDICKLARDSGGDSVAGFEKEWKKQQSRVHDQIAKEMDKSK